jgi:hypothetical protein
MEGMGVLIVIVVIIGVVLLIRLFGAWMLRIDEVIKHQKEIVAELKKSNNRFQEE